MERSRVHCLTHHDLRGYQLLDESGWPYVAVEALRCNGEALTLDVIVDLDRNGEERPFGAEQQTALRPHVLSAIEDVQKLVGTLPIQFQKRTKVARVQMQNWLSA